MTEELSPFQQKLRERRLREETEQSQRVQAEEQFDSSLIPDVELNLSDEARALDQAVEHINILDAYRRWSNKSQVSIRKGQREGIMVSCPNPDHPDRNPSAWINLDKQTWYCASCSMGGDAHDIAAWHYGYSVPGYKEAGEFPKLRQQMAEEFGFLVVKHPGGVIEVIPPAPETDETEEATVADVTVLDIDRDEEAERLEELAQLEIEKTIPHIDWRQLVPSDTFLRHYMDAVSVDDSVEMFHFFNGLMAVGMAIGRDATLKDTIPVYGNLFQCSLGSTGTGKSKAKGYMMRVIREALPIDRTDPMSKGVEIVANPGSGEVLVQSFYRAIEDPADPKKVLALAAVRGVVDYNELSALIARAGRTSSTIKSTLMDFYDASSYISTTSLTTGKKEAQDAYASLHTTSQLQSLRGLLESADNSSGFLNRWLFVLGERKKRRAFSNVVVDITPAVGPLRAIQAWASSFRGSDYVTLEPEAMDLFEDFFARELEPLQEGEENMLFARVDLLFKKLILLFAANKHERVASLETVQAVISLLPYIRACYQLPAKEIGRTEVSMIGERIMGLAAKRYQKDKTGISMRDIGRSLARHGINPETLARQVDALVKLGLLNVEQTKSGTKGRPTARYIYAVG